MTTQTNQQEKNYYEILDVAEDASPGEIQRQYERLIRLYQPDRMDDPDDRAYTEAKRGNIEEAYAVLSDPAQRAIYDGKPLAAGDGTAGTAEAEILYCANHPGVETLLRCNRCGKPICMKCAVQTPVGYRCRECVHQQQNVYFNAAGADNLVAFGVGLVVAAIAAPIVGMLIGGFGFLGFIIAFIAGSGAGSALAQIIRRAVGRRRGRYLPIFALVGIVLGVLIGNFIFLIFTGRLLLFNLPMLVFTVLAIVSAYPQLR